LLHWLRDVLLQDAVFLMAKYPGHPIFQDPVFWSPQFNAFADKVRSAAQESFEDGRGTAIEKVIPEVSEKLRSLTAYQLTVEKAVERRHLELVQEVKLLKAQVADMCRMEYQVVTTFNLGGRLHRTEQFARRQGHEPSPLPPELPRRRPVTPLAGPPLTAVSQLDYGAALAPAPAIVAGVSSPAALGAPAMTVTSQGPPQIRFPRTLHTVGDLYQLWRYGFATMPAIDQLKKQWGSRWRLRNESVTRHHQPSGTERQLFSMRKVVMDEVVRLAGARGWPEEDAVREVEKQRIEGGNLSLDALAKQLKATRKL
ncbi:transcriptional activator of glycolytic enzymes-domain-containing protein, partial [Achaetomium macrosporum]